MNKNQHLLFWALLATAILMVILASAIFFYNFGFSLPKNVADWGTAGDFFGGVLNPTFAFLALIALLAMLRINQSELLLAREELALTREELKKTAEFTQKQAEHVELQSIRDDMRKLIDKQLSEIEGYLNAEFYVDGGNETKTAAWFIREAKTTDEFLVKSCKRNSDTLGRCINRLVATQWNMVVTLKDYLELGHVEHTYSHYKARSTKMIRLLYEQGHYKDHIPRLSHENKEYFREFAGI